MYKLVLHINIYIIYLSTYIYSYEKTNIEYQYNYSFLFWIAYKYNSKLLNNNDGNEETLLAFKWNDATLFNLKNFLFNDNLLK